MVGVTVVPVIRLLSDMKAFSPIPNAVEVEKIFDAPLDMFLKDEKRRENGWEISICWHYFDFEAEIEVCDLGSDCWNLD
ncbi:hypothetical protein CMV_026561 [Castanea mollissima]|uniref:Uncharacterized protein n=1 Tax=Castanea mollissima TaxID=60419 RepID=A0A8J4QLL5_9ROSI|nr:hypothetical protein CMV_026561 [Castanea mollissima]